MVRGIPRRVLRGVSFTVAPGESYGLVGESGCGKSTTAYAALGLLAENGRVAGGRAVIAGREVTSLSSGDLLKVRRDDVSMVYQDPGAALNPTLRIGTQVAECFMILGATKAEAAERAFEALRRVRISDPRGVMDRYPHQLSGGMRKRVSLAQMLILDPQTLLMDEPFSALDVQTRSLMENELLELWSADRKSVIFITHDLEEAISLSDRVVVLSAGPATHPIGEYAIDLPRPRDVSEIRLTPRFIELHDRIWHAMKAEVLKGYAQTRNRTTS